MHKAAKFQGLEYQSSWQRLIIPFNGFSVSILHTEMEWEKNAQYKKAQCNKTPDVMQQKAWNKKRPNSGNAEIFF